MKNFLKLLMLAKLATGLGYRLSVDAASSICNENKLYFSVSMYTVVHGEIGDQLIYKSVVTDDELEPYVHEVLDYLTSKVLPTGENNVVLANGKLFSVTKKDDCFYCWSDDEIGELLKSEVIDIIEGKFNRELEGDIV